MGDPNHQTILIPGHRIESSLHQDFELNGLHGWLDQGPDRLPHTCLCTWTSQDCVKTLLRLVTWYTESTEQCVLTVVQLIQTIKDHYETQFTFLSAPILVLTQTSLKVQTVVRSSNHSKMLHIFSVEETTWTNYVTNVVGEDIK